MHPKAFCPTIVGRLGQGGSPSSICWKAEAIGITDGRRSSLVHQLDIRRALNYDGIPSHTSLGRVAHILLEYNPSYIGGISLRPEARTQCPFPALELYIEQATGPSRPRRNCRAQTVIVAAQRGEIDLPEGVPQVWIKDSSASSSGSCVQFPALHALEQARQNKRSRRDALWQDDQEDQLSARQFQEHSRAASLTHPTTPVSVALSSFELRPVWAPSFQKGDRPINVGTLQVSRLELVVINILMFVTVMIGLKIAFSNIEDPYC
ncbi:hypothetical protein RHSIM_Rhsim04G0164700 [Rhododendron simsii]|uniref:Uncharacterized protein n=1 Tax=Rhododendron simsii TaxID=118357 RepID=A0A834LNR0_RHOSS|nr:hypothetical protein RHSIM_Rhsim04G0164700 [Rhododendron simsii]